jgi:hypothetical protein
MFYYAEEKEKLLCSLLAGPHVTLAPMFQSSSLVSGKCLKLLGVETRQNSLEK